jgi:hypothetical protein
MSEQKYTVSYGKPPQQTRFQKGRSGNPNGRPRKSKNTATIVRTILDEEVLVTKNGEQRKMSSREAMLTRVANKGLAGDIKAVTLLIPGIGELEPALAELQRENEAKRQEQFRILRAMTLDERQQYINMLRAARKRADETEATKKKPDPSRL